MQPFRPAGPSLYRESTLLAPSRLLLQAFGGLLVVEAKALQSSRI